MPDMDNIATRLVARVRALLPSQWRGWPGKQLRRATEDLSNFSTAHNIRPSDLASEGVVLGRRKLHGIANKEFAAAVRDFADAEQKNIDNELRRRSLETDLRAKEAVARKQETEARIAEAAAIEAEITLTGRLNAAGITLSRDRDGNLTIFPLDGNSCLDFLTRDLRNKMLDLPKDAAEHGLEAAPSEKTPRT